jgi:hypothetical protein
MDSCIGGRFRSHSSQNYVTVFSLNMILITFVFIIIYIVIGLFWEEFITQVQILC